MAQTASGGALTSRSGALTTGGTSQEIAAANPSRQYLIVQNPKTATETLFVEFGAAADPNISIGLEPGEGLLFGTTFVPTGSVNVRAATTGHKIVCKEG